MRRFTAALVLLLSFARAVGCDLCAVYNAGDARGGTAEGLVLSVAEQFIPYRTTMFEGEEVHPDFPEHVDSSITHLVVGYNFSSRFGVSLNVPLTYLQFKRMDVRYSRTAPLEFYEEAGVESGLGDVALIGRFTLFNKRKNAFGLLANVLAGLKFPTGDDSRIQDEIEQTIIFDSRLPPGTPHDPLGHSITAVHEHMLALGSGSFDGIFGLTINSNWKRWFANAQFQYYLRTEAESDFKFGNEVIVSGGLGFFLVQSRAHALSLQANAVYDSMAKDELLGEESNRTGMTAVYLGPLLVYSHGNRFSANLGVDVPLHIENNWLQVVPDYRLHGGLSWKF